MTPALHYHTLRALERNQGRTRHHLPERARSRKDRRRRLAGLVAALAATALILAAATLGPRPSPGQTAHVSVQASDRHGVHELKPRADAFHVAR